MAETWTRNVEAEHALFGITPYDLAPYTDGSWVRDAEAEMKLFHGRPPEWLYRTKPPKPFSATRDVLAYERLIVNHPDWLTLATWIKPKKTLPDWLYKTKPPKPFSAIRDMLAYERLIAGHPNHAALTTQKPDDPVDFLRRHSNAEQWAAFRAAASGTTDDPTLVGDWRPGLMADVVFALHAAGAPAKAVRDAFKIVRETSPESMHKDPTAMLRYAAFPIPEDLPEQVTVFRGLCVPRSTRDVFERATSPDTRFPPWVLERDAACAMAMARRWQDAIVVRRTVPRSAILYCSRWADDDAPMTEVIFDAEHAGAAEVAGELDEWLDRKEFFDSEAAGCPVIGPVGTGSDPIENVTAAMDSFSRDAVKTMLTSTPGSQMCGEIQAKCIPIPLLGPTAVALFKAGAPKETLRGIIHHTWVRGYRRLVRACSSRDELYALFRYADYPIPDDLPARVTVYRGTTGLTVEQARTGMSWTLHREMACWYAIDGARERGFTGAPLVLRREMDVGEAVFYAHDGVRSEMVFGPDRIGCDGSGGEVDGDPTEWVEASRRFAQAMRETPADTGAPDAAARAEYARQARLAATMHRTLRV